MPDSPGIIRLELARATDLFETPTIELGSSFGSTVPGVDRALGELTADRVKAPVRLEVALPSSEVTPDLGEQLGVSLRHYCAHRRHENENEVRAMKRTGWRALRIGFPITLLGLVIVGIAGHMGHTDDPIRDVVEITGWVFAWLGLWYPFDKVLFYPLDLVRQNRALVQLQDAAPDDRGAIGQALITVGVAGAESGPTPPSASRSRRCSTRRTGSTGRCPPASAPT